MGNNPLKALESMGQSVWLDYIHRHLLESGGLQRLIDEDGVTGVTSNPAIFEKAIAESQVYDAAIRSMAGESPQAIYDRLSIADVRQAADQFRPVYDRTDGRDGFVSLEVSPFLARDTDRTIDEARRLWQEVDRPNVLIKVPGTPEGLPAIRQLISEGINVNVTLLFSLLRHCQVMEAYLSGLDARVERGKPLKPVTSVASFFLSRIDVLVDPILEARMHDAYPNIVKGARLAHGQVAIACARLAYQQYLEAFSSERFRHLVERGASPQRVLWASTSTKNPAYSDVKYVEALIGPETINTIPLETLEAYRDHGQPESRLEQGVKTAREILDTLPQLGIDLEVVARQLESEGIEKFARPFEKLLASIAGKTQAVAAGASR